MLATVADAERIAAEPFPFERQAITRSAGVRAITEARDLVDQIGQFPSMAALADPDSDLAVFMRRTSPGMATKDAYEFGQSIV